MKHTFKSLLALLRIRLSALSVYRLSFFTGFFVDAITFVTQLIFLDLLVKSSHTEWSQAQYAMFVGSFMTIDGAYMATWFFGVISLPDLIRSGELDGVLLKPVHPLLYTSFCRFDLGSVPVFILGLIITLTSAAGAGYLNIANVLAWLFSLVLMYLLMYALSLMIRSIAFWTKSIDALGSVENVLVEGAFRVPLPAVKGLAKWLWLLVLPYGLIGNFPALALSGMTGPWWWLYASAVTAAFLCLALFVWKKGLARYESASS